MPLFLAIPPFIATILEVVTTVAVSTVVAKATSDAYDSLKGEGKPRDPDTGD